MIGPIADMTIGYVIAAAVVTLGLKMQLSAVCFASVAFILVVKPVVTLAAKSSFPLYRRW